MTFEAIKCIFWALSPSKDPPPRQLPGYAYVSRADKCDRWLIIEVDGTKQWTTREDLIGLCQERCENFWPVPSLGMNRES